MDTEGPVEDPSESQPVVKYPGTDRTCRPAATTRAQSREKVFADPRNLAAELRRRDGKIGRLEKALEEKDAELTRVRSEAHDYAKGKEEAERRLRDLEREHEKGADEGEQQEMLKRIAELEGIMSQLQSDYNAKAEENERLKAAGPQDPKGITYYKKKCEEQAAEITQIKTALDKFAAANEEEIERFKARLSEQAEQRVRDLASHNDFLQLQVTRLQDELGKLKTRPGELNLAEPMESRNLRGLQAHQCVSPFVCNVHL